MVSANVIQPYNTCLEITKQTYHAESQSQIYIAQGPLPLMDYSLRFPAI